MKGYGSSLRSSAGMGALALFLATPALAQDKPADAPQTVAEGETKADGAAKNEDAKNEEIVVTGTNISGVKRVGSESIVLKREDVLATGKSTVSDVLRTLPQIQNVSGQNSFDSASNGGSSQNSANPSRGTAINLRGVGQGATLTLVDGHRITPTGTANAFTEANQVPISAIERVEVIVDGASAVYGSDAIAGVINYVLRKDFSGVELSGRYTLGAYGNDEKTLSGTAGVHWNAGFGSGSIIGTFEYYRREPYVRGQNPRLRQDQRAFGGNDNRISGNSATVPINGNIFVPTASGATNAKYAIGGAYTYYALPLNPNGNILSTADLLEVQSSGCTAAATPGCAASANLIDRSDFEDYLGKLTRKQAAVFLNQDIGALSFDDEFFWTRSDQLTRTYASGNQNTNPTVLIKPGSPYYAPLASLPNLARFDFSTFTFGFQPIELQYNLLARTPNGPRFQNQNPDESFNNTFGVRTHLFGDWKAEAYYTFGQNKTCGVCYLGNYIALERTDLAGAASTNALQHLIDLPLTDPLHLNPLSTAPLTSGQLNYVLGTNSQYSQNWSHDFVAKLDGALFAVPAGPLKAAIGAEYYSGIQKLQNDANRPPNPGSVTTPDARARTARQQYAAFGELYIPLIGEEMSVPLIRSLDLSGALRYDHYSDFGSTTNGKVSATWEVGGGLRMRGSWGTSFRAPGLPELNAGSFSLGFGTNVTPAADVLAQLGSTKQANNSVNILTILGNNPNLKPEQGVNWQVGADFTPEFAPGLRLSATYYHLTYKNKLGGSGIAIPFNSFAPGVLGSTSLLTQYKSYVIPLQTVRSNSGCTLDSKLAPFSSFLYVANIGFNPRDLCNVDVLVDARTISAANTMQDGLDANASYVARTGVGMFNFGAGITKILHNKERQNVGDPLTTRLDTIGDPIGLRGRGNIGYNNGPFSATLFANYIGAYTNDLPITLAGASAAQPVSRVPSYTSFDLSLALSFARFEKRWGWLKGTRFGVSVTNVFDTDPPIVNSVITSGSVDPFAHGVMGRFVQFSLTKAF